MAATDEKAIHEFPTGTIDDNSLLIMDRPTLTPGEYETEKFAIANLGLKLLGGIDFPNNLDTDEQDIFGAINEVNAKAMNISDEYDETESYSKGDYCIYQNAAYRCIKASGTTTGSFVAADWAQIKILNEIQSNAEAIDNIEQAITPSSLRTSLVLDNFCVYSAERILANATKDIPLTQNLFALFFKSYADSRTFGVYLISFHGSVASGQYITQVAVGTFAMPTLSIVDGNKLRIATSSIDIYYSMLRLN